MNSHEVFDPKYWSDTTDPLASQPVRGGRISGNTKDELKILFGAAVANLKVGGPVEAFDAESTLDWNGFEPGTVLLLDQESMHASEPLRIDSVERREASVFEDVGLGARGALLQSNRSFMTGPIRLFVYYSKSGYDPETHMRYNRYINLAAILPGRKNSGNRVVDFLAQSQTDTRNQVLFTGRTAFKLPAVLGQATILSGDRPKLLRVREAMVCHTGSFESAKKPAVTLGKLAFSATPAPKY